MEEADAIVIGAGLSGLVAATELDVLFARARYGAALDGCVPTRGPDASIRLSKAKHPLLDAKIAVLKGMIDRQEALKAEVIAERVKLEETKDRILDARVINLGKISADVSGISINILQGRFINAGIVEGINGGTVNAPTLLPAEMKVLTKTSAPYSFQDADGTPVTVKYAGTGSVSMCMAARRLSRRRQWQSSCASTASSSEADNCCSISRGNRMTGRRIPTRPGSSREAGN